VDVGLMPAERTPRREVVARGAARTDGRSARPSPQAPNGRPRGRFARGRSW
jgi:hypothetical protein